MPSTPSQKSIDVCRSAPTIVMWCTPWLWSLRIAARSLPDRAPRRQSGDPGAARAVCVPRRLALPARDQGHPVEAAALVRELARVGDLPVRFALHLRERLSQLE